MGRKPSEDFALPTTQDLAWVAGFLEGEGSFFVNRQNKKRSDGTPYVYESWIVKASQVNREPLERLQQMFGGSLCVMGGPSRARYNPNRRPAWQWVLSGSNAKLLTGLLMPQMSSERRIQMARLAEMGVER